MKRATDLVYRALLRLIFVWAWLAFAFLVARATNSEDVFYAIAGTGLLFGLLLSFTLLR
jgi:hypothetical protein